MAKGRSKILDMQIAQGRKQIEKLAADLRISVRDLVYRAVNNPAFVASANKREALYKEVAKRYIQFNEDVNDWIETRAEDVAKAWHGFAVDDLPAGSAPPTFGQFSKKYFDDIVGKINPTTIDKRVGVSLPVNGMLNEDIRAIRSAVSETIRKGALVGLNINEMSKEMKSAAEKLKTGFQFVDKAGKKWNTDSYFNMLNRTLTGNVSREVYQSTLVESGNDLVVVEGTSTYAGSPCIPYEGEVLSLTGATKGYTTVAEAMQNGLFHVGCIHSLSVYDPDK